MMQAKTGDGIAAPGDNQRRGSAADQGQSAAPGRRHGARKKRRMGLRMGELRRRLGSVHGIVLTLFSPRYMRWISTRPGWSTGSSLIEVMQYILSYAYLKYCCGSVLCLSYCKDNTLYAYSLNCSKDEAGKCAGPSNMDIVYV
ncbi:hypothetical protein VPH35_036692 [Triticum aestivum]|uniref:Uncharacterized protein n=1 Tax=Aegilops tauschii subsp. strangulata TaxID=200361 RepID=A0A453BJ21_AEGTS